MIDIQKMKQAALDATQGEWISQHWSKDASDVQLKSENTYTTLAINCSVDDATHISAANPSAVLELITRLEAAEEDRDEFQKVITAIGNAARGYDFSGDLSGYVAAMQKKLEAAESTLQLATTMYTQAISTLEAAEQDAVRWKAFVAEAERDYVEVSNSEEPYYQRFECAAAMEEYADAAMKESK